MAPYAGFPPHIFQAAFFVSLLLAASVADIRKRVIPDSVCALIALAGLICFSPAKLSGALAALPLLIAAIGKEGSIGGGDIKLTAASGLVLGFAGGVAGLMVGLAAILLFFAGGIAAHRIRKDKVRKKSETALPMAPFLSTGFIIVYLLIHFGF